MATDLVSNANSLELTRLRQYFFRNEIACKKKKSAGESLPIVVKVKQQIGNREFDIIISSQSCEELLHNVSARAYVKTGDVPSLKELFDQAIIENDTVGFKRLLQPMPKLDREPIPDLVNYITSYDSCWFPVSEKDNISRLNVSVYYRNKTITKALIENKFVPRFVINNRHIGNNIDGFRVNIRDPMYPTYERFSSDVDFLIDCSLNFKDLVTHDLCDFLPLLDPHVLHKFLKIYQRKPELEQWINLIENILKDQPVICLKKSSLREILTAVFSISKPEKDVEQEYSNLILCGQTKISKNINQYIKPIKTRSTFKKETKYGFLKAILKPTSISMQIFSATAY
jgi:hypothetical protein